MTPLNNGVSSNSQEATTESSMPLYSNANFFMHKKLSKFTRLRQVGQLEEPDLSKTAPNKTFTLIGIAKDITRKYCPEEFISDIFLNQALELFVALHKGQDLHYIEDLPPRDFKWIEEILLDCKKSVTDGLVGTGKTWQQEHGDKEECISDDLVN